ncbi:MAG TPA: DMT family transporter [Solirubrobacterales bacterium]|nr:DMT family transporter [Solirubrobacterales bacterium]
MLGVALGLAASVSWGISDFIGGLQTRRFSALSVLLVSQPVGLVLAFGVALAFGDDRLPVGEFLLASAGGAAVVLALAAFYRAMALGSVSVAAMIAALGVVVPVAGGLAQGEEPGGLQALGVAIAIPAVVLIAREPDPEWRAATRRGVGLAGLAALGFGVFFLLIAEVAETDPAWTIAAARVGGVFLLGIAALYARPKLPEARGVVLAALLVIGFFDVLANSLYAVATNHGILPLVSVAASLYSAVTVLLARVVLRERLAPSQRLGFAFAIAGVALIAAGA